MNDLDAYFARIGYEGPREPTLPVLQALHLRHPQSIAFESLDPFLGRPVSLDPAAIRTKLVHGGRGGYCFEQNALFCDVLDALGFKTTPLAARVIWGAAANAPVSALTHRLTKIDLPDGSYIADVGFGGQSPTQPISLELDRAQTTPHGTFRVVAHGDALELQFRTRANWEGMYRFTLEPRFPADYELGNWFTSTHPRGRFTQSLVVARISATHRLSLFNREFSVWDSNGVGETQVLASPGALERVLTHEMGLTLPAPIDEIWRKIPADA